MEYIELQITSSNPPKNVKWSTDPPTSSGEMAPGQRREFFLSFTPP